MKRVTIFIALLLLSLIMISAEQCNLDVSLINQDPYPAIPGEYVKVIFQINGVSNPDCNIVEFKLKESYPFTIDASSTNPIIINSGTYTQSYSSFYLAPYKIRVDKDALKGDTPIEVSFSSTGKILTLETKEFDIYIENTIADFEVHVKEYNPTTNLLTLEILNIEDVDVEALTIEIPKQENIQIKGANKVIVGSLDSNEYTTADFEAVPKDGKISLQILYTDSVDVRREITKTIDYDSSYFKDNGKTSQPVWLYLIILAVVGFFVWRWWKKRKLKKKLAMHK